MFLKLIYLNYNDITLIFNEGLLLIDFRYSILLDF